MSEVTNRFSQYCIFNTVHPCSHCSSTFDIYKPITFTFMVVSPIYIISIRASQNVLPHWLYVIFY